MTKQSIRTIAKLVIFVFDFHKIAPVGGVHRPDLHINPNIRKVRFDYLQQIHVPHGIGHNIGFKSLGIAGISQQFLGCHRIIGIFIFQVLRPLRIRETPPPHIIV